MSDAPEEPARARSWLRRARGPVGWSIIGATVMLVLVRLVPALVGDDGLERGELVILSGRDDSAGAQRQQLINEWNSMHPDTPARIKELSPESDEQHSEMIASAQSGAGESDIYNLDVTWVAEFAAGKYIRPLKVDTTGFLAKPLATCLYADELWAMPFNTDAGLLYYRTDLIDRNRLPSTVPPNGDYTKPLLAKNRKLVDAYAGQFFDYEGMTVNALEAIWAAGGEVLADGTDDTDGIGGTDGVAIDSEPAQRALISLARALQRPEGGPSEARAYRETETTAAFLAGRVAIMRNWPVQYGRIMEAGSSPGASPTATAVSRNFAVAPLPGHSVLGGQNLAVARDTRKPRAAQALVEFLTSEESQLALFKEGAFAATRASAYQDQHLRDRRPYAGVLLTAINAAKLRPVTPHYVSFSSAFRDVVDYALDNDGALREDAVRLLTNALQGRLG